ncbi:MAG: glycogen synthase GlgA [Candidatus Omnitrophota bacterium]
MKEMKILFVSPEVVPFAKTGGLADVAGTLPIELSSLGHNVKTFMPYYRQIKKQDFGIKLVKPNLKAKIGSVDISFSLYHCQREKTDFYFIENDEYYDREFLYGTPSGDYSDNAIRFAFFASAVLSSAVALNFKPDIIHYNDWQSALIPFYIKFKPLEYAFFSHAKTFFTVHNLAYQGLFPRETMHVLGIRDDFFTPDTLEFYGKLSFMKAAILYSDALSTVSKGYAEEILTPEFGCGLDGLLRARKDDLYGVINGVDYSKWSPKTDAYIKANYDEKNVKNKSVCKKDLLETMKLDASVQAPLLGVVSRLAEQKGIDIIADSVEQMVKLGCNLIVLGTGDEKYHHLLTELSKKYPKNISVKIAFDNTIAHKIEAGCDMFLMPSRYEPCGLNQMYSLKYGTIPVVRGVGGLEDTIIDYTRNSKEGNGFKFSQANIADFMDALRRAVNVYKNKKEWEQLTLKAMSCDFSWKNSAKEYIRIYNLIKTQEFNPVNKCSCSGKTCSAH